MFYTMFRKGPDMTPSQGLEDPESAGYLRSFLLPGGKYDT